MSIAVDIQGLTKDYRNDLRAVDDLSFQVERGQIMAFLGPNGAGKTTTIKMVCGLIKPTSGRVTLNGYDVQKQRADAMRQIGAVLEGTRNVYWRLTAWDNVLYFGRLKGQSGKAMRERAEMLLTHFGLWDRRDSEAGDFSRGMQQKLAIACALIADPPIILLDEPTLGLDVQAARTIKEQVQSLARTEGKTIIITTHDLQMAQTICDHAAIIRRGKLITDQPMRDLLQVFEREYYVITVTGHDLSADIKAVLDTEQISVEQTATQTRLAPIRTQETVHRLLEQIRAYDLTLVSVERVQPSLEDIFLQLTADDSVSEHSH